MPTDLTSLQLFATYREGLRDLLRWKRIPEQDVDDILQEVFLGLSASIASGAVIEDPKGYIFRIMRNVLFDRSRRPQPESLCSEDLQAVECTHSVAPEVAVEITRLLREVDKLKPTDKAVVNLRLRDGWRHKEIGRELDLSPNTIPMKVKRIKARLRMRLGIPHIPDDPQE